MQEEKPNQRERIVLSEKRVGRLIPANVPIARREEYYQGSEYYSKHREKHGKDNIYYRPKKKIYFLFRVVN